MIRGCVTYLVLPPRCEALYSHSATLDIGRIRDTFTLYLYLREQLRRARVVHDQRRKLLMHKSFQDLEGGSSSGTPHTGPVENPAGLDTSGNSLRVGHRPIKLPIMGSSWMI